MKSESKTLLVAVGSLAVLSILVSACASEPTEAPATEEAEHVEEDEHMEDMEEDEHMEDMEEGEHMDEMDHGVPEEASPTANPFAADEESVAAGAEIYASSRLTCHGETGEGDGPAAAGLEKPPADLHEDHVQVNTDGALFYIITHGRPDTPMPA